MNVGEKMKFIKRSVPLWALILALVAFGSIALAAIVVTREVSLNMVIQARYDMKVYDTDHATELTSINLGTFYRGDKKTFPSDAPTTYYFVDNIGEADIWLSWSKAGTWPSGVTITMYVDFGGGFQILAEGSICAGRLYAPPSVNNVLKWYFEIEISETAEFDSYSPTLRWNAHSSSTG